MISYVSVFLRLVSCRVRNLLQRWIFGRTEDHLDVIFGLSWTIRLITEIFLVFLLNTSVKLSISCLLVLLHLPQSHPVHLFVQADIWFLLVEVQSWFRHDLLFFNFWRTVYLPTWVLELVPSEIALFDSFFLLGLGYSNFHRISISYFFDVDSPWLLRPRPWPIQSLILFPTVRLLFFDLTFHLNVKIIKKIIWSGLVLCFRSIIKGLWVLHISISLQRLRPVIFLSPLLNQPGDDTICIEISGSADSFLV